MSSSNRPREGHSASGRSSSSLPTANQVKNEVKSAATDVADTAGAVANEVKRDIKQVAAEAKRDFGHIAEEAETKLHELGDEAVKLGDEAKKQAVMAADKAKEFADEKKGFAAEQLDGVASALTRVADELDQDGQKKMIAGYARTAAEGIEKASHALQNNSVDGLIGMAEDFSRKQPIAFMGAAAIAGFVASRFLMASAERRRKTPRAEAYRAAGNGSGARTTTRTMGRSDTMGGM